MKLQQINLNKILVENRLLWHFGFWLMYFFMRLRPYYNTVQFYDKLFLKYMLLAEILFFITVYLTLFLYNKLLPKKQFILFFCSGLLAWILYVIGDISLKKSILFSIQYIANYAVFDMFLDSFSYYILFYFFIVLLKYFKDNFIFQYNQNHIIQQRMLFELENLKAQISPHFLFNTMNNFYGLAVDNSKILPNLMIRLSNLLRYSLYETKQEKVPLENEIKYLENYIELEKIRLEDNLDLKFIANETNFNQFEIAPLLLITFLENAFKHSKNILGQAITIKINIDVTVTGILKFEIKNNYNPNSENNLIINHGIGLDNVKKRLEVIYPNENHSLKIEKDEKFFKIILTINLI